MVLKELSSTRFSRLMSGGGQAGLLREPTADDDDERLQSVHINVPEFPIAT